MYLLDTFENKYIVKGIIRAEAPLHIGGGNKEFSPIEVDSPVIRDEENNPFIPGSSMKGVLRSFCERLINAGVFQGIKGCNVLATPCVSDNRIKDIKMTYKKGQNGERKIAEEIYKGQCDICRIFGGIGFGSKLHIIDAKVQQGKAYTQKRDGIAIDRDTLKAAHGKKYDFECVSPGAEFNFEMTVDNLDENHGELLKVIISFLESGDMKVGGKTSAGLGNIKLKQKKVYKITKENVKEYYLNGINEKNESLFQEVF